jgi:hypothetical protein
MRNAVGRDEDDQEEEKIEKKKKKLEGNSVRQ